MAHLYCVDTPARIIAGETVRLVGDEANHAARAARLRVGERIFVSDGYGTRATAEAISVTSDLVELVVVDSTRVAPDDPALWLAQALAKSGRDEQAVEQATEVGVSRVIPLSADRSVVKWDGPKQQRGQLRWQKIAREAAKQSLNPWIPVVEPVARLTDLVARDDIQLIVLDHRSDVSIHDVPLDTQPGSRPIVVAVGPEGGWEHGERELFQDHDVAVARLGSGVLRASSAGPIALALLHTRLGQW